MNRNMNTLANTLNYKTLFHYTFEHFVQNTKLIIKKKTFTRVFIYVSQRNTWLYKSDQRLYDNTVHF